MEKIKGRKMSNKEIQVGFRIYVQDVLDRDSELTEEQAITWIEDHRHQLDIMLDDTYCDWLDL